MSELHLPINRRQVLALGGSITGGLIIASAPEVISPLNVLAASAEGLPVKQIEAIMETSGTVMNGVLSLELDRNDLQVVGPGGIPFKPAFELTHEFYFQALENGQAFLNVEMTLLPHELNPVIDKIFEHGLFFMAEHQHFFDEKPQTFHIHYRGIGDPVHLAKAAMAAVRVTGTPLPQPQPSELKTPLDKDMLAHILGGTAQVSGDGVVTVSIPRAETIVVAGVALKPEAGVSVTVAFEPLDNDGMAACAPDFALIASEVNPALRVARAEGFQVHCLYNQETAEQPQLYFSHNLATGNAIELAKKVARVLDKMHVKRV